MNDNDGTKKQPYIIQPDSALQKYGSPISRTNAKSMARGRQPTTRPAPIHHRHRRAKKRCPPHRVPRCWIRRPNMGHDEQPKLQPPDSIQKARGPRATAGGADPSKPPQSSAPKSTEVSNEKK